MSNDRIYYSRDAEEQANREKVLLTLICVVFGLGIGAAIALLFAPAAGNKVRHELAKNVEGGLKDGRDAVEPTVKRLEEELKDLRKNVEDRLKK